ncbi:MAG: hypothetical protein AAF493_05560 [Pseudomonadota bacterium]
MTAVLFLCPHNAAKSILAAGYYRAALRARGLDGRVQSAGTEPDAAIWPSIIERLNEEGIEVEEAAPRLVTATDLAAADRVISLGCERETLNAIDPSAVNIEFWNDVPLPSQDLDGAQAVIKAKVTALVDELSAG